jgi:flavin prenyltransferase
VASVKRIVVGITGSTGSAYGIRLLEVLRATPEVEVHLVISAPGKKTLLAETDWSVKDVEALAHVVYDNRDIGAALASGSFRTAGMAIAPCSVKTVSQLASCHSDTLIARAGDVTLKEGRTLVAVVRETPLHVGHLRQMLALAEMGAVTFWTTRWDGSWTAWASPTSWCPSGRAPDTARIEGSEGRRDRSDGLRLTHGIIAGVFIPEDAAPSRRPCRSPRPCGSRCPG